MAVFYNTDQLPAFNNAVITIGTFDGVHHGHRQILEEVAQHAIAMKGESIVLTFEPHPRKLLFPEQSLKLLTPLEEKLKLIIATGVEHVVVVPFTKKFSELSAQQYVEDFLVKKFQPKSIIIGYDHHFGHDRTGNIELLRQLQDKYRYEVTEIPAQLIEQATVSSTKIRNALLDGKVEEAAHMLDRIYSLKGTVIEGAKLGRTLGYPTANMRPLDNDQLIPANGIYAVRVQVTGKLYGGMMSIGFNPTVTDKKTVHLEVNIFNFNSTIYGEEIKVQFVAYLRAEEKFNSLDALKEQLHRDKTDSLRILKA